MIVNESDLFSFGTLLREFRLRKHLTQQQLAEAIGVHRHAIGRWEQGDVLPAQKAIVLELAKHLHLDDQESRQLLEASLTALAPHWLVPLPRNPLFTGREEILVALHAQLGIDQAVALTQSSALHGLGGVGKTQVALEYAYRHAMEYSAVFWIGAETDEQVTASLLHIAETLQLPERENKDQQSVTAAVQRWLSTHKQWLLIWDNVEDLDVLHRFLPSTRSGSILITTRRQALSAFARSLDLLPMEQEEGILFLLRRAKVPSLDVMGEQVCQFATQMPAQYAAAAELVTELGGLPLALDQAGAYLEETHCGLPAYLELFRTRHATLLTLRGKGAYDHPTSVSTTFTLALRAIAEHHPAVQDLLQVCALLQPDAIPEELFRQSAEQLGATLQAVCSDPLEWDQVVSAACSSSLLHRQPEEQTLSMHRLVHAVLLDTMTEAEREQWSTRVIGALEAVFPEVWSTTEYASRKQCDRLLLHALHGLHQRAPAQESQAVASLAFKAALALYAHARYVEAEPLYLRALRIREQTLGPDHPEVASSLNDLGNLYWTQRRHTETEPLYLRALRIREQALGPDHPEVGAPLCNLVMVYGQQGRYAEAELLYSRALHIWEQALGPDHPNVAYLLINMAGLYREQDKYAEAELLYSRALHIWEQALGPDHPNMAEPLLNLAELCREQGRDMEAEAFYHRALSIQERRLGSHHPEIAETLHSLAVFSQKQGKVSQAFSFAKRALSIRSQSFGNAHPETIASRTLYDQLLQKQAEIETIYQRRTKELLAPHNEGHQVNSTSLSLRTARNLSSSEDDSLQEFLEACCELHPRAWCRSADLWQAYEQWVKKREERYPLSRTTFTQQLKAAGCRAGRTNSARIWHGITLVNWEP